MEQQQNKPLVHSNDRLKYKNNKEGIGNEYHLKAQRVHIGGSRLRCDTL